MGLWDDAKKAAEAVGNLAERPRRKQLTPWDGSRDNGTRRRGIADKTVDAAKATGSATAEAARTPPTSRGMRPAPPSTRLKKDRRSASWVSGIVGWARTAARRRSRPSGPSPRPTRHSMTLLQQRRQADAAAPSATLCVSS